MSTSEIFSLIAMIFAFLGFALILYLILSKTRGGHSQDSFDKLEDTLVKEMDEIQTAVTKSLFDSMLTFNKTVNSQLLDTTQKSSDSITDFRLNVNKELVAFQEKIAAKLTSDFGALNQSLEARMNGVNSLVEARLAKGFQESNDTFIKIAERVKVIDEAQKKIESLSEEMISLQQILSNNQKRGMFGEYQLNQLLYSVFGENNKLYSTQYTIREEKGSKEAVRADAVVFMPEPTKLIAIDSKFPFSSYSKLFENKELSKEEEDKLVSSFGAEVKKHITDISSKYIVSGITADFAIMFVASDGILSLLHSKLLNVIEYARTKSVTICSPSTFIPLISSFKAIAIDTERSKYAKEIKDELIKLGKEFRIFESEWQKLSSSIQSLSKQSDTVNTRVEKITQNFTKINKADFIDEDSE